MVIETGFSTGGLQVKCGSTTILGWMALDHLKKCSCGPQCQAFIFELYPSMAHRKFKNKPQNPCYRAHQYMLVCNQYNTQVPSANFCTIHNPNPKQGNVQSKSYLYFKKAYNNAVCCNCCIISLFVLAIIQQTKSSDFFMTTVCKTMG